MNVIHRALMRIRPASLASALKRILRIRRRVVETSAGRFYIDPVSNFGAAVVRKESYEPELSNAVRSLLRPGDLFVDVGANEGFFTVVAAKQVGPNGVVVAIEPQSRLQSVLARNVRENDLRNVEVVQRAVSDSVGVATLSVSPDMNTGSSGLFRTTRYETPTEDVLQTTLGHLFSFLSLKSVRLLKMDIEGFEYEAVLGSRELFQSGVIEHFALELHPTILERRAKSEREIVDFLASCGYRRDDRFETLILTRQR
jgi:FkbM family methyltransferase